MRGRRAAVLLAMLGCAGCSSAKAPAGPGDLRSATFPHQTIRAVDVLFVIADGPGSQPAQAKLANALPSFAGALAAAPGGLPDLHVAVVSADLGAGPTATRALPACAPGGDRGVFQSAPRGACPAAGLRADERFFSSAGGTAAASKPLADALACLTPLGDGGCAFGHPLAAALRALGADGAPAPPENAGFLRASAFLSIILLADDDDCSAPADSPLFDASSRTVADPLGPLTTFRCAEAGLLCGSAPPPRRTAGPLTGCASAEDRRLLRVADFVTALETLKGDRNRVLVAAVAGPPAPYAVALGPAGVPDDPEPWPSIVPACTGTAGAALARPAVRIEQAVYAFGHNASFEDLCAADLGPSLKNIGETIAGVLGPPCLAGRIATTTGPGGARPDCTITDYPAGVATPIPSCLDGAVTPCWSLTDDPSCPGGKLLGFTATPGAPPVGIESSVQCRVCDDAADPRCPAP